MMKKIVACCVLLLCFNVSFELDVSAKEEQEDVYEKRLALYKKTEAVTGVPWYWLAGVDAYERGIRKAKPTDHGASGVIHIYFSPQEWVGPLNMKMDDEDPVSIALFEGVGQDGNGNGKASLEEDEDILYTFARYLQSYGYDDENIRIGLWDYYQRDQAVNIITGHARLYKKFQQLDIEDERAFPVPLHYNYSYRSTWGDRRGWGGRRIHEGTDIFAGYNTPVRSTAYGVVELKGWNKYGGWRIGIRDLSNTYHYYAHLSSFAEGLQKGDLVKPGETIGYVGSSGYGKPGTQGKFPPHLHYGMYRDNGYTEWSFDPYPSLKKWEREERKQRADR